jgi:hypothetical protein
MKSLAAEHELYEGVVGLQISIRKYEDVAILDLRGRSTIDGGESELLSSDLQELITNGVRKVLRCLLDRLWPRLAVDAPHSPILTSPHDQLRIPYRI